MRFLFVCCVFVCLSWGRVSAAHLRLCMCACACVRVCVCARARVLGARLLFVCAHARVYWRLSMHAAGKSECKCLSPLSASIIRVPYPSRLTLEQAAEVKLDPGQLQLARLDLPCVCMCVVCVRACASVHACVHACVRALI